MIKISEFQIKDVVNITDGKRLGNIGDIEINLETGKIEAVIVSGAGKVLGLFGRDEDIVIAWKNMLKIGEDVILVRYKDTSEIKFREEDE
ncbi:YlmC/YmxH family sporulation protein [Bacillus canaveralius]|uniref:YlmC/YmxH family sporulation protein n=1 Tax=Bacillus canaveralius TaxID=1403243 RepID=A0A2N5GNT7_9BACI|nr:MULTISPECIES: YlmC/YmxH family sporulation protein [Bacillus]PLR84130.1 YlmC/YmxH family sporulation protein [Bacillus canaveralius]PLR87550.1 YlmC/YmxH family sporulation protein [Bacillus sp. V33-4]PLR96224.1 YlmC/YmxH family sporulation protein [Bacillus canaveralius]RSK53172.1 YlmC/YmxH family sporulation protein [Bacillus canaveralius]